MATTAPSEIETWFRQKRLTRAQFGGVLKALETVGGIALKPFELEEEFIGRPVTQALLTPLRPILPDDVERVLEFLGPAVFAPSNFIPFGAGFKGAKLLRGAVQARRGLVARNANAAGRAFRETSRAGRTAQEVGRTIGETAQGIESLARVNRITGVSRVRGLDVHRPETTSTLLNVAPRRFQAVFPFTSGVGGPERGATITFDIGAGDVLVDVAAEAPSMGRTLRQLAAGQATTQIHVSPLRAQFADGGGRLGQSLQEIQAAFPGRRVVLSVDPADDLRAFVDSIPGVRRETRDLLSLPALPISDDSLRVARESAGLRFDKLMSRVAATHAGEFPQLMTARRARNIVAGTREVAEPIFTRAEMRGFHDQAITEGFQGIGIRQANIDDMLRARERTAYDLDAIERWASDQGQEFDEVIERLVTASDDELEEMVRQTHGIEGVIPEERIDELSRNVEVIHDDIEEARHIDDPDFDGSSGGDVLETDVFDYSQPDPGDQWRTTVYDGEIRYNSTTNDQFSVSLSGRGVGDPVTVIFNGAGGRAGVGTKGTGKFEMFQMATLIARFRRANPAVDLVNSPENRGFIDVLVRKYGDDLTGPSELGRLRAYTKLIRDPDAAVEWRTGLYLAAGFDPVEPGNFYHLILPAGKKVRHLEEGGIILRAEEEGLIEGLQFGGITSALGDVGKATLTGLATVLEQPGFKQVGQALEFEQQKIGRPITDALLTPFKPFLPEEVEQGIVSVGSAFLTPSSLAMFFIPIGRAVQGGRILAGGVRTAAVTGDAAKGAAVARLGLRELFAPSSRQIARLEVARKSGLTLEELMPKLLTDKRVADQVLSVEAKFKSLRKMTSRRWQTERMKFGKDDMEFTESILASDIPAGATAEEAIQHLQNNAWWSGLIRGDAIDPKQLPDNVGLFARLWNPLKAVPFIGPGLEVATRLTQPIALMNAPVRRAWVAASGIGSGWNWQANVGRDTIGRFLESAFGQKAVLGELTSVRYTGPRLRQRALDAIRRNGWDVEDAQKIEQALRGVKGRLVDIAEHPEWYRLNRYQKDVLERIQRIYNNDRLEALAVGVNIGEVNYAYVPHRLPASLLTPGKAQKLGEFVGGLSSNPRFAPMFRRRTYDFDSFVARAQEIGERAAATGYEVAGPGIETNMLALADWRLGHAARKKAEQYYFQILKRNPETASLVGKPSVLGPRLDEALEAAGLPFDAAVEALATVPGGKVLAQQAGRRVQVTGRELRLKAAQEFSSDPNLFEASRDANRLLNGAVRREEGIERTLGRGLDYMRSTLLSADISPLGMVQGMRIFAADPIAYLAQIGEGAAWLTTRHGKQLWALQNLPNIRHWTKNGLTLGNVLDIRPEMLERLTIGIMGKKIPTPFSVVGFMNRQLMDAVQVAKLRVANTMASTMALAQRSVDTVEVAESLPWFRRARAKLGPSWQDADFDEVSRAISDGLNNAIGPINFNMVNRDGAASFAEKFLILTPSWTRGNIGQVVNAAKAGPKGVVARWLVMNQLGVGAFLASKISMAFTGELTSFDPRENDFLSVKMPWGRFNILPAMPLYRLPVRLMLGRDDFDSLEGRWTEFLRFSETRMGQVPRIAIDLIQGEDFLGRRIDDKSLFFLKELLPIIGQEIVETRAEGGVSGGELAQRLTLEFLGSSVIPKTPFQLERERVEEIEGKPFDEVARAQIRRLRKSDPTLRNLIERQKEYRQERGGALNQFFNILADRTEKLQAAMDEFLAARPTDSLGFMSAFGQISSDELQNRAVASEEAQKALGIEPEDLERAPTKILRDALAIEYWTVRPELEHCRVSPSADAADECEDVAWTLFRDRRQAVLGKAPSEEVRQYIIGEFTATRFAGNPIAEEFERRRVQAQLDANRFFETSPYLLPNGLEMPDELLDTVFKMRKQIETIMITIGTRFREASGLAFPDEDVPSLPSGTRQRVIAAMLSQESDPLRQAALSWQILWETSRLKDFLRNPRRDEIMLANTDMIKFRPDIFGRFIRAARIIDQIRDDPELVDIAAGQG